MKNEEAMTESTSDSIKTIKRNLKCFHSELPITVVAKIVEGALEGDMEKILAYSKFLADKLKEEEDSRGWSTPMETERLSDKPGILYNDIHY